MLYMSRILALLDRFLFCFVYFKSYAVVDEHIFEDDQMHWL